MFQPLKAETNGHIKVEQNYIFSHVFNRGMLRNSNWAKPQVGKVLNFKPQVSNLNFGQATGGLKSHDASDPLDSFWSYICIFLYF